MRRTASARKNSRSNASLIRRRTRLARFAVCITEREPDLQQGKVYRLLPDEPAARSAYVRVVDESGEDYLYPKDYFVPLKLPGRAARAISVNA